MANRLRLHRRSGTPFALLEELMKRLLNVWQEEDGVLSFEWTLLVTLLTIGIVGGLAGARDAIIDELGDLAEAAQGIDQSYSLSELNLNLVINGLNFSSTAADSTFLEAPADAVFTDCGRVNSPAGQPASNDGPS
jgi:Flp pilus assembly pilin Flp